MFLIVSIQILKGNKLAGVRWGTRCSNICIVLIYQPKIIIGTATIIIVAEVCTSIPTVNICNKF